MNANTEMPAQFELVTTKSGKAIAAILTWPLTPSEFYFVNGLLPGAVVNQPELAGRWNVYAVLSTPQWACEQLRLPPMRKPETTVLQILMAS